MGGDGPQHTLDFGFGAFHDRAFHETTHRPHHGCRRRARRCCFLFGCSLRSSVFSSGAVPSRHRHSIVRFQRLTGCERVHLRGWLQHATHCQCWSTLAVAVDPWLPLWWTAVVAWLVARAQFCVSRGCVGSARRRRSTCCWMASLRSRPRPLLPAALLHCLRGSRDASGPRTSVRCRPAASGSTLGASTSLLACGASAAPLGFARRRYGSSASMASQAKEP